MISIKKLVAIGISVCLTIMSTILYISKWDYLSNNTSFWLEFLGLCVIGIYVWSFVAWTLMGHRVPCIYIIFLIYAFTSNAGQTLLHWLRPDSVYSFTNVYDSVPPLTICKMLLLQLCGIAYLNLGAIWGAKKGIKPNKTLMVSEKPTKKISIFVWLIYGVSYGISLVSAIIQFISRQSAAYGETNVQSITNTYILYAFAVTSFYILYKVELKWLNTHIGLQLLLLSLYSISGTRTAAIPLVVTLAVILYSRKPYLFQKKFLWIYIPGFILLVAFSGATAFVRTARIGEISYSAILRDNLFYVFEQAIYEMGMSAKTVCTTISAFEMGNVVHEQTILYSLLLAVIPRPFLNIIGITAPAIGSLSAFATGNDSSGAGFSFLAEFFFDFGLFAPFFLLLYGYVIAMLERKAYVSIQNGKYLFACIILAILAKQVFFARAQFDLVFNYIRNSFYIFIIWAVLFGGIKNGKLILPGLQEDD